VADVTKKDRSKSWDQLSIMKGMTEVHTTGKENYPEGMTHDRTSNSAERLEYLFRTFINAVKLSKKIAIFTRKKWLTVVKNR